MNETARPYVYKCTHKQTGVFYIGFRCANKLPAQRDISVYKTSSPNVHDNFDDFDAVIIGEFPDKHSAYDSEQALIFENLGNPLMLNRSCFHNKTRFISNMFSPATREKLSLTKKGKPLSEEHRKKLSIAAKARASRPDDAAKRSAARLGTHHSDETKSKMSLKRKGMPTGKPRPAGLNFKGKSHSDETKMKQSEARKLYWASRRANSQDDTA